MIITASNGNAISAFKALSKLIATQNNRVGAYDYQISGSTLFNLNLPEAQRLPRIQHCPTPVGNTLRCISDAS
jgi:hypothetical protein